MIRLWFDEERDPQAAGFVHATWVKNYASAVSALQTGDVVLASLGDNAEPVVQWMEENNVWPRSGVSVHSQNPAGKARMLAVINKHYKFCTRG